MFAGRTIILPAMPRPRRTNRPLDQRAVPIEVEAKFADGRSVRAVTLIVDQNPTPVAARFDIGGKREHLKVSTLFRLNAGTDVRAIVEASDGQLYMAERFVKFAGGQAACSAPPSGSPEQIAATMGSMSLKPLGKQAAATRIAPARASRSCTPTIPAWCSTS